MGTRLYQSIGLPIDVWKLLEDAAVNLELLGVLPSQPTQSDVMTFVIRHGIIRIQQLAENELDKRLDKESLTRGVIR